MHNTTYILTITWYLCVHDYEFITASVYNVYIIMHVYVCVHVHVLVCVCVCVCMCVCVYVCVVCSG